MKISDAVKSWLLFDLCFTIFLFAAVGVEGVAELACEFVDHENCEQFNDD